MSNTTDKTKKYRKQADGSKLLQSAWTNAESVELTDGRILNNVIEAIETSTNNEIEKIVDGTTIVGKATNDSDGNKIVDTYLRQDNLMDSLADNSKEAQYNMLKDMNTTKEDVVDSSLFVGAYEGGSTSNGKVYKRAALTVWNYIKSKMESVLGLTSTQYNGNSATATKATQDANGNVIPDTYLRQDNLMDSLADNSKEAQYNLIKDIDSTTDAMGDNTIFANIRSTFSSDYSTIYKRTGLNVWNYIKSKIESVLGLTSTQYNGNSATATKATRDGNGNIITSTYATKTEAQEALNIAKGKNRARVFSSTESMQSWLSDESNKGVCNVGDNLYIVAVNVPDWWISEVLTEVDADTGYYYKIAQLEIQKVDLTTIEADLVSIHEEIDELGKSVSDGKSTVASAITEMGVSTESDATFEVMASNINDISKDATAVAEHILSKETAYVGGEKISGKMVNYNSDLTGNIPSSGTPVYSENTDITMIGELGGVGTVVKFNIDTGFYGGEIVKFIPNLDTSVIKYGVNIGNASVYITGHYTGDATASAGDIVSGLTAYSKGEKITGTITEQGAYTQIGTNYFVANSNAIFVDIPEGVYRQKTGSNVCEGQIPLSQFGTAAQSQVLSGVTFTSSAGHRRGGTMADRGAVSTTLSCGGSYTIPRGYHNGSGVISAADGSNGVKLYNLIAPYGDRPYYPHGGLPVNYSFDLPFNTNLSYATSWQNVLIMFRNGDESSSGYPFHYFVTTLGNTCSSGGWEFKTSASGLTIKNTGPNDKWIQVQVYAIQKISTEWFITI